MDQYIQTVIDRDLDSYSRPYYHPDDFAQDRVSHLAIAYSGRTLASHRREVARCYDEIRRLIRLGIPRHLQEQADDALFDALYNWDDYIVIHRREQFKARERLLHRPLLDRLLDLLDSGSLRFRCGHRARRNLLQFMDGSLQTIEQSYSD